MRMGTRRPPASVWIAVLKKIMPILTLSNVSDLILFGSQAMSVYMERALTSKDIDLIAPGITETTLEKISEEVTQISAQTPSYDHVVSDYSGRKYPVSHIYLRHKSGFPFVIEFFDNFIGYESTRLNRFLNLEQKWGLELQVPLPEAIIGTRLAFRPPERISSFNAIRLNRFIKHLGKVNWTTVNTFIDEFDLRTIIKQNLTVLKSKQISIIGTSRNILEKSL
jgi:hypothetical protein